MGKPQKQISWQFDVVSRGIDELQSFARFITDILEGPPDWGENEDKAEHDAPVDGAANDHRSMLGRN